MFENRVRKRNIQKDTKNVLEFCMPNNSFRIWLLKTVTEDNITRRTIHGLIMILRVELRMILHQNISFSALQKFRNVKNKSKKNTLTYSSNTSEQML